jgi:16S rRNA (guanine527-N7)-methyltransferase
MRRFEEAEALAIRAGALELGLDLLAASAEQMARHLALVYEENEHLNLTRIPREKAVALHVLDSLAGVPALSGSPEGPWLDLGSGAGFPGVVLALASTRRVVLLESVGKKSRFLETVCRDLCLEATVLAQRAEEAALVQAGQYSAVAARAVSSLPALVELASPLLCRGGLLMCWKADPEESELRRGDEVARRTGMRRLSVHAVSVPGSEASRCLVVFDKTGEGSIPLPRRTGLAQSRPLA